MSVFKVNSTSLFELSAVANAGIGVAPKGHRGIGGPGGGGVSACARAWALLEAAGWGTSQVRAGAEARNVTSRATAL